MAKLPTDNFCSQAVFQVTETAANTLTFDKLETGISVYDKIGWVIARVEIPLTKATYDLFDGNGDILEMGLTATNTITAFTDTNPAIYVHRTLMRRDVGTPAVSFFVDTTIVQDFSTLPGGGILVLPNPLYLATKGTGLSGASTVTVRVFFKAIDMNDQDYFNLVQARQLLVST